MTQPSSDPATGTLTIAYPLVSAEEFPNGLRCPECRRPIDPGQPYKSRFDGMTSDAIPITELLCVYC